MPARLHRQFLLLLVFLLALTSRVASAEDAVPSATAQSAGAPRREGRFQNNYIDFAPRGFGALLRWKLDAMREGLPPEPRTATPRLAPDLEFLRRNGAAG